MWTREQITAKDLEEEDEEERPLMIKGRKHMQGTLPNLKVPTSHTMLRPQQP
jgi:hypothetical protein